jgi:hypothetical protein
VLFFARGKNSAPLIGGNWGDGVIAVASAKAARIRALMAMNLLTMG